MPMRATTIRFSEDLWATLESEAAREGVSVAQLVRDAALIRLGVLAGRRGDPDAQLTIEQLAERGRRRRAVQAADDDGRLAALRATGLLDTPPEEAFDRLANLARRVVNAPGALISLLNGDSEFLKSSVGLPEPWASSRRLPLSHSFARYPVADLQPLIVTDAREHPGLRGHAAIEDMGVVAYVGIPLVTADDRALGALSVFDSHPRVWTADQVDLLRDIAGSVMTEIELRTAAATRPQP
ncbi:MAG: sensor signal transduction histidine kinase [Solirubrobacterales bacterium]|jgi:GAF domain-containing protein|nr:sensor signal transduction histidine kinase [Solirubrobacterales bacterium]